MAWGADVVAAYTLDNTKADNKGAYDNLVDVGTGLTFDTNNPIPGYTYAAKMSNGNYAKVPADLKAAMADLSAWTLEYWAYLDTSDCGFSEAVNGGGFENYWLVYIKGGAPNGFAQIYYPNSVSGSFTGNLTDINNEGLNFISMQWDGSAFKIYINGVQKWTVNTALNVFDFAADIPIMSRTNGTFSTTMRLNKVIFSSVVRNGEETLPAADGKAGIRYGFNVGGNSRIKIGGTI